MLKDGQPTLQQSVVAICDSERKVLGTGFFIGNDGSLLTCFHVIGNKNSRQLHSETFLIYYQGSYLPAECILGAPEPERLDVAILRLTHGKLPDEAALLAIGKYDPKSTGDNEYHTFGFRSPGELMGLNANGKISGEAVTAGNNLKLLQLSSQSAGQQEIRFGMSGAPVFHMERVVGMVATTFVEEGKENIPLAIPIDAIAKIWQPLENRFQEQELYDKLLGWLSPGGVLGEKAFEKLCKTLPEFFKVNYQTIKNTAKPQEALLQHIKTQSPLYTFVNWLHRNYDEAEALVLPSSYHSFVNRNDELNKIIYGATYTALDAPRGYGKTALLRHVEISNAQKGWLCFYAQVPENPANWKGFAISLQEVIGGDSIVEVSDASESGDKLGERLVKLKKEFDKPQNPGTEILLLIDNLERLPDHEVCNLVNDLIPAIYKKLESNQIKFRVCFAGRAVGNKLKHCDQLKVAIIGLTPFDFDVIKRTIVESANTPPEDSQLRAAHLMHITGGHPGCMAKIIQEMNFDSYPDKHFKAKEDEHKKIVLEAAEAVRNALPDGLREIFEVLSFFRRFNHNILKQIIAKELIVWDSGNVTALSNNLTQTYLVERGKDGFLQDAIVRRLLNIRIRLKEPKRFIELNKAAQELYETNLKNNAGYSDIFALERLFVHLQLDYYGSNPSFQYPDLERRKQLKKRFFAPNGILFGCLEELAHKSNASDIFENLQVTLERDWEFTFVLNYFLREDKHNSFPYQEMKNQINKFLFANQSCC